MYNSVNKIEKKSMNFKNYEIKIFWDYQNIPIRSKEMGAELMSSLMNLPQRLSDVGTVVSKEIYADQENKCDTKWNSQLHSCGFKFIHCSTRHLCEGKGTVEVCEKCKKPLNSSDVKND